ncbi:histidine kinase [Candidatus Halobeggiatoa sp. HSG11]|nr:histidine kinase [Candidatus Halobeggiatoa sp. HSG11]
MPNFYDVYTVFLVVLVTELLAFIFVLTPLGKIGYEWNYIKNNLLTDLAMTSLFMQWISLLSMVALCGVQRLLHNNISIGIVSYFTILLITYLVSEFMWWINASFQGTESTSQYLLFLSRNLIISAIISAIVLRYFYIQYQWKNKTKALATARVQSLQARIRPHFLFNSMNTIAGLIRFQPDKAERVVEDFADLFRASLTDSEYTTLQKELILCQQYLSIEKLRFEKRLQVIWDIDKIPQDACLPPLSLQPLLENAVYHGIQPLAKGGTINITGILQHQYITITITNPIPFTPHQYGNHIAQQNIRQRLQFFYNSPAKLITSQYENTYQVSMYFPYITNVDQANEA